MRLLESLSNQEFHLTGNFLDDETPVYAILSHTWGEEEVVFGDIDKESGLLTEQGRAKTGYAKIKFCGEQAAKDGFRYFWVDSCCIDKSNSQELQEAITSMFRWYQRATRCYVYLSDVITSNEEDQNSQIAWEAAFRASRWFTRGWTLQELLGPESVNFFSAEGNKKLGDKVSLKQMIHEITGIALAALEGSPLSKFARNERMGWAKSRKTLRPEDRAYSLLGIFGVSMGIRYGEGPDKAFERLHRNIDRLTGVRSPLVTSSKGTLKRSYSMAGLEGDASPLLIPFSRDPDFVENGTILDQLRQKCSMPGSRTALVGLGGVGKSQLAIEHAYRTRDSSPETGVFWIHASNAERFEQSYRAIAMSVNIPGRQSPNANILQLVHDWLCYEITGSWLLILDNVDDTGFLSDNHKFCQKEQSNGLYSKDSRPLISYLPQSIKGSILITSRAMNAARKLVEPRDMISVEPMNEADGLLLLENKLGKEEDRNDLARLAAALEFMPLALVQASAYISHRAPRCSVKQYVESFQRSDRKGANLLDFEGGQLRRDGEAKNSITTTWQISFDHVCQIRQSAADMLSLMSFFDRQGISAALLQCRSLWGDNRQSQNESNDEEHSEDHDSSQDDNGAKDEDDEFEDDIATLRDYSFISITEDQSSFEMHRLVQLATRKWLQAHGQQERWKHQSIRNLCAEFPIGKYKNWPTCRALFPHAKLIAGQKPEVREALKDWASIMYKAASYAIKIGHVSSAVEMSEKSMEVRTKLLGQEDERTLKSMGIVADTYRKTARWTDAEVLEVQVMEAFKRLLGQDHPNTLISMNNLARTYHNQHRWKEAEELNVQTLETRKKVFGHDHPGTLASMNNLAITYCNQDRWKEAEELEVQTLETRKKVLGHDHPSTLTSMSNLALTYHKLYRWKEAEELNIQTLEIRKKVLGHNHPDTLRNMGKLAWTIRVQGRWNEAESLEMQALEGCKRVLGQNHPDTLIMMSNLACTFWDKGERRGAIALMEECLIRTKDVLGPDHQYTKSSEVFLDEWRTECLSNSC
ncbi:MAG: hypothetical protein M1820_009665 [Bogoriella megaspora]|nr:MAG: hypothetical protein M1820_009665 [Bogoriella megaspora]